MAHVPERGRRGGRTDHSLVGGHREHPLHHAGCVLEVLSRLEERRDAHRVRHAALDLKKAHREDVGGGAGHRDTVGSHALGGQSGEDGERVEHLANPRLGLEHFRRWDERAALRARGESRSRDRVAQSVGGAVAPRAWVKQWRRAWAEQWRT